MSQQLALTHPLQGAEQITHWSPTLSVPGIMSEMWKMFYFIYFEIMVVDANRVFIWLVNADFICHICTIYNALVYDLLTLVECRPAASVLETVHVLG